MDLAAFERDKNLARFLPGERAGHYESWFQRANHPTRPLAFWIRYTLFSPKDRPEAGLGELWAIVFDGETGAHVALKREVPIAEGSFDRARFRVDVGDATLAGEGLAGELRGSAGGGAHRMAWDLSYRGDQRPLFFYPLSFYGAPFPKAKSLVGAPLAVYAGTIDVDGRSIDVGGWVGSQNHNWGSQHTDRYAWGQVAGFDDHPRSFLEVGTGKVKIGRVWTPFLTSLVLRHEGREHALNGPLRMIRAQGSFGYFDWRFTTEDKVVRIEGRIHANRDDFVGLTYLNPPGGIKHCLNSKIATCDLTVTYKSGTRAGQVDRLRATRRAGFEILTDDRDHSVTMHV
ncbi:Hypothetical protein A7982_01745 [Minicystis rosea]|nr:Hypothetical protein A7982_01745 [Minicystis rosea]